MAGRAHCFVQEVAIAPSSTPPEVFSLCDPPPYHSRAVSGDVCEVVRVQKGEAQPQRRQRPPRHVATGTRTKRARRDASGARTGRSPSTSRAYAKGTRRQVVPGPRSWLADASHPEAELSTSPSTLEVIRLVIPPSGALRLGTEFEARRTDCLHLGKRAWVEPPLPRARRETPPPPIGTRLYPENDYMRFDGDPAQRMQNHNSFFFWFERFCPRRAASWETMM